MVTANIQNQTITLPIVIFVDTVEIEVNALLDCGATGCYIHQAFMKSVNILLIPTPHPIWVRNIDGTDNKSGNITSIANVDLLIDGIHMKQIMHVTDLGNQQLILGLPWLRR